MTFAIDHLLASLDGVATEIDGDVEGVREKLLLEAERFLLGGGTVSLVEWSALGEESKVALAAAGTRIRDASISLVATAIAEPTVARALAEGVPPEDVELRVALEAAAAHAAGGGE